MSHFRCPDVPPRLDVWRALLSAQREVSCAVSPRTSVQPPRHTSRLYSTRVMPNLDRVSFAQPRHRDALRSFVVVLTLLVRVRRRLGCRRVFLAGLLAASVGCTTLASRPMSIAYCPLYFGVAMSRALRSRRAQYRLVSGVPRCMYASSPSTPPPPWWVSCHSLCVLMRPGDRSRFGRDPSVGIVCSFPVADQIVFRPRICTIRGPTHVP